MALTEIPLLPAQAQSLTVNLGARVCRMRLWWNDAAEGAWVLDLGDEAGAPLACGIPLFPQQDALEPYAHLGLDGSLYVDCTGEPEGEPTFEGLGTRTRLFFRTPQDAAAVRAMGAGA